MGETKSIKGQIEFLIKLQVLDKELYALNSEKKDIPLKIKTIDEALESKKQGIKQAEADLKGLQVRLKDREVALQQKEDQVKKLQLQLYQLKSNKEYSAMLAEIGGFKADNSLVEEEILRLMDDIDAAKRKLIGEKEGFAREGVDADKRKDEIRKKEKEIDSRLSGLSDRCQGLLPNVDKQILVQYEKLLKKWGGLAIVPVQEGACGGCHMNLPPQVVSEAKLKEDIIVCGSCSRILYIDDNVEIN